MDTVTLPPCPTEDSTNCFWDAAHHGNGEGVSYFVFGTTTVYLNPDARVESVTVSPHGPFSDTGAAQYAMHYSVPTMDTPSYRDAPPAYDLTFPLLVIGAALLASAITLTVGFFRRVHI